MILAQDFEDFIRLLNKYAVAYMVVGGYALAFHGKPRYTGDLDIWINISEDNAVKMLKVMKDFGMSTLGFEKEDFLRTGYITQIGYPPLRIDILNNIDGLEFTEAIKNMQQVETDGLVINYIGLHDFLKNKQASGRSQDIADIEEIKKKIKSNPKRKRPKL
ncbi:MAG: nucleotidyltransferase [Sphingobacteriia bacterium]|nr:nucleotidyltransferase [Sphingobacteriia bacterium]